MRTLQGNKVKAIASGLAWCAGISFFVALGFVIFMRDAKSLPKVFMISFGISMMYSFLYWLGSVSLVEFLNWKYDWLKQSRQRIIYGAIGTLIVAFGVTFLIHFVQFVLLGDAPFSLLFSKQAFISYLLPASINIIMSIWFHLQSFFTNWKKAALNEERLKTESAEAKLEALQQQVDPHFLFNTFNVLTALIEEDAKLAQKFVTQLSKVYRYVLEMRSKTLVSLTEEMEFANSYLFLLKIRFEEAFTYEIDIPHHYLEKKLIPISIQLLVENAIKHNVVSKQKPLHLKIYIEDGYFCVSNNLNSKEAIPSESTGIGLTNISSRYKLIDEHQEPVIQQDEHRFIVKLPLND